MYNIVNSGSSGRDANFVIPRKLRKKSLRLTFSPDCFGSTFEKFLLVIILGKKYKTLQNKGH